MCKNPWFIFSLLVCASLFGQTNHAVSPEQIQEELIEAEATFNKALELFNPWYTGPLITPSASMMPPGEANIQPYLFLTENYASFNSERDSVSLPDNLFQLKGNVIFQTGITQSTDILVSLAGQENWQNGKNEGGYGDTGVTAGFLIQAQTVYVPAFKFTVAQTFPTGKYKNLDSLALKATGAGAYTTQFGLATSKVIFWSTLHPMSLRAFVGYSLSTDVHVKGFNSYGGGFGCNGKVKPGNSLSCDFGAELSFTQKWVGALDVVYTATNHTSFQGNPGTFSDGSLSSVGSGFSDQLSLAPAIEYNFSANGGIILGGWFSIYGRNSLHFGAGVLSFTYTFP